jgi:Flp pilus assembly protein TadD
MTSQSNDAVRRLIPRWRYFHDSPPPAETFPDRLRTTPPPTQDSHWDEKVHDWSTERSVSNAAALVAEALVLDRLGQVQDAVDFLNAKSSDLTLGALQLSQFAARKLRSPSQVPVDALLTAAGQELLPSARGDEAKRVIAQSRHLLALTPRDPFAWMDMARAYTTLGQVDHARRAMKRALSLAPRNRLILRAECRRLIHSGRVDEARHLILRNERSRVDPWLISAEIATSQVLDEPPRLVREGKAMLESGKFSDVGVSELAGALGTLEFINGSSKRTRNLLEISMKAPTDNAVAQARWLAARMPGVAISDEAWKTPQSYEAWCWRAYQLADWENALRFSQAWVRDEPFSSRAAIQATFLATTMNSDYRYAIDCARQVAIADSRDTMLRNNLVVALAYAGRIDEAMVELSKLPTGDDSNEKCTFLATHGLVAYRGGSFEEGRRLYRDAFDLAPKDLKIRVAAHWAREEARLDPQSSIHTIALLKQLAEKQKDKISERVLAISHAPLTAISADKEVLAGSNSLQSALLLLDQD